MTIASGRSSSLPGEGGTRTGREAKGNARSLRGRTAPQHLSDVFPPRGASQAGRARPSTAEAVHATATVTRLPVSV